jgi:tetratricopeptide (TPR) repeat protein
MPLEMAAHISGMNPETGRFVDAVADLRRARLVENTESQNLQLVHGVVSEIVTAHLPAVTARTLHARAAREFVEEGRSVPAVLAIKHDIAGERIQAFSTALRAAEASKALGAVREHEYFLKLALSNAPDPASDAEIRIDLGNLLRRVGRPLEALDVLADPVGIPSELANRIGAGRLAIRLQLADANTSIAHLWAELERLRPDLDPSTTAELYYLLAAASHRLGKAADALAATKRAMMIVGGLPATPQNALTAARSAVGLGLYSSSADGLAEIEKYLNTARNDLAVLGPCLIAHGTLLVTAGRLFEAEQRFLEAIHLSERYYLYDSLPGLHNNLGVCYTEQGNYVEARAQFHAAREGDGGVGCGGDQGVAADNIAMLQFESGDFRLALETARSAQPDESRSSRTLYYRHALIGLCSLELGLLAQAFEAKREIELLFDQHEYWSNDISYVETFLARMLVLEDRVYEARERLATAIEVYRPRDVLCRARLELELARIDVKREPAAALARAESMLESLRGTGARPLIDRFEELADRARRRILA